MKRPYFSRKTTFASCLAGLVLALLGPTATLAEQLTLQRIFAAPGLAGAALRGAQLAPNSQWVAYLKGKATAKDQLDLWIYDIASRQHRLLVDSDSLAGAAATLSAEEEARRERQRTAALSGIVEYQFSPDSRFLLVPLGGELYLYDLRAPADKAVRQLTKTSTYETDAKFSPLGKFVSFVREQNLFVIDIMSGGETAITNSGGGLVSFGMAEFIAQEEMDRFTGYWWSPDDSRIAFARVDESGVDEIERFEIFADSVRTIRQRYPAAGRPNAKVELWILALGSSVAPVQADLGANQDQYLARVNWFNDSRNLAVQRQSRDQKTLDLLRVDANSGKSRLLLSETSPIWTDLHDDLTILKRQQAFIWASSRSGFKHLYLYDLDGQLIRPITAGDWQVIATARDRAVAGVDERRGYVYFVGNRESPMERHLYRAPLRSKKGAAVSQLSAAIKRLSSDAGWHSIRMSNDARYYLDTFSNTRTPPRVSMHLADGTRLDDVVANRLDASHPYFPYLGAHRPVDSGILKAADGQTLYWQMLTPPAMQPGKRYPVMINIYGGPTAQLAKNSWPGADGLFRQYMAQQGYVVFTLDNRGSGARGVAFETALHRNMGTVEVTDQVAGVEYLRSLPFVDGSRIGVFGWSYGGYMALRCMLLAPEHFAAGVAGAPVTDWSLYDTHYTERYMLTPASNPAGYAGSSVLPQAARLRGPLLLIHGMADDNVLFTNTTTLMKKLQDLNLPFELMTYPGAKHGLIRNNDTARHAYAAIKRFFDERLANDSVTSSRQN